jgi:hypothetical protein
MSSSATSASASSPGCCRPAPLLGAGCCQARPLVGAGCCWARTASRF